MHELKYALRLKKCSKRQQTARKQTNKSVKSAEKPVETVADGLEEMYNSGAYDLQTVTQYLQQLLKSSEVYAKAGDDDLTFPER